MIKFADTNTWDGGFYELGIYLGVTNNEQLEKSLESLWRDVSLKGCYLKRDIEPEKQVCLLPNLANLNKTGHFLGIAMLPDGNELVCGTMVIRDVKQGVWLVLYIPMGSIGQVYSEAGGYPFGETGNTSQNWRKLLEDRFAQIGIQFFQAIKFSFGIIGYEVTAGVDGGDPLFFRIPEIRRIGYLCQVDNKIGYFPTYKW